MSWWDANQAPDQPPTMPPGGPLVDGGFNPTILPPGQTIPGIDPGQGIIDQPAIGPATPQQGGMTYEQLQQLVGNDWSPGHLQQILPQLQAAGVEVQNQARGDLRPRFRLPSGEVYDFGPGGWQGRGQMSPGFGDPSQAPTGGGYGGGAAGGGSLAGLNGMSPTDYLRNTPGYQFALQQGLQGVERSAAGRGTLLTGGTLKALQQYGTGLADQTYGNAWQRFFDLTKLGQQSAAQTTAD